MDQPTTSVAPAFYVDLTYDLLKQAEEFFADSKASRYFADTKGTRHHLIFAHLVMLIRAGCLELAKPGLALALEKLKGKAKDAATEEALATRKIGLSKKMPYLGKQLLSSLKTLEQQGFLPKLEAMGTFEDYDDLSRRMTKVASTKGKSVRFQVPWRIGIFFFSNKHMLGMVLLGVLVWLLT